ncbi:MAG: cyclase family protein [Thermanaerothrix sp.]|jgi:arylformamidase|uniref:Cyclase family protein n=1 Tax=Thermanaerothrix solaris TaxID=3058434 RepID=A0ABU3NKP7_9CHLR|nr:cyclase family protein [Thermanaerothrix sp. 4228-RoL]MDT8897418.1 cyclase family protein [Thermanaerothrix sp. 4228-RoL]
MRKIHDISLTIGPDLPTWPSDPSVRIERVSKIEEGANANVSKVEMGLHTGTHLDAPYHFLPNGARLESLALEVLIGPAQVIEVPEHFAEITADVFQHFPLAPGVQRVLFKTRNSRYWAEGEKTFRPDFVGITQDGAEYLVEQGVRLVGIDYLSVAPYKRSRPTHEVLLQAGVVIIEGLDLSQVRSGLYHLICLPIKFQGVEGGPARAILIEESADH